MKARIMIAAFCGTIFTVSIYCVLTLLSRENAAALAVLSGLLFSVGISLYLFVHEIWLDRRYGEAEKAIASPVFFTADGNLQAGCEVRYGRVYFCESGIVFISAEKPYTTEELPLVHIEKYSFDNQRVTIRAADGRVCNIVTSNAQSLLKGLKERNWIL